MASTRKALRDYERSLTMSNSTSSATASANGGIGIFGLITVVLLVFKLAGMAGASWGLANLSWFWVFAPLLFGIALSIIFIVIFLFIAFLASR